jgi:hypothetical protein
MSSKSLFTPEASAKLAPNLAPVEASAPAPQHVENAGGAGYSWSASQKPAVVIDDSDYPNRNLLPHEREAKRADDLSGPSFIKPGTGGKIILMPNGVRVTCGGELLRLALQRGGKIIGEKPTETFKKPTGAPGTPQAGLNFI